MEKNITSILLPVFAGTLRILLAYQAILFTTPIMMAVASNLYIVIGLYALQHALKNLKALSPTEKRKHTIFFYGCCVLFISRGATDLYRYLSPIYGFQINPTFFLHPTMSYSPILEMFATNLPIISLATLTTLAVYHLCTTKSNTHSGLYNKLVSLLDVLFISVTSLLCLTHSYASLSLLVDNTYYAAVISPYSAIYISQVLSGLYEPLASMVLLTPRFTTPVNESKNKFGEVPSEAPTVAA